MPTTVAILTFMSGINFVLSWVDCEKMIITWGPSVLSFEKIIWRKSFELFCRAKAQMLTQFRENLISIPCQYFEPATYHKCLKSEFKRHNQRAKRVKSWPEYSPASILFRSISRLKHWCFFLKRGLEMFASTYEGIWWNESLKTIQNLLVRRWHKTMMMVMIMMMMMMMIKHLIKW